jgi:lipopolysaccharide export system protein LptA
MNVPVSRLRRWFAAGAILMIAIVGGMYFYARWRVRSTVREVPAKLGLDIQQTAEGFSISKSVEGRTQFTVSASKAVQFKEGGRAELHDVKIIVYGADASRFDRITGDDFEFDPKSGEVTAQGKVLIDLEGNPEGKTSTDQTPPSQVRNPIHVETEGLTFNKNTGDASASGKVMFETSEATGSALGVEYVSRTGTMTFRSAVDVAVAGSQHFHLKANRGVITKGERRLILSGVRLARAGQNLKSEEATFFLRPDNTVERIVADGDVSGEFHGKSEASSRSDRAEFLLTGTKNQLTTAILSGHVQLMTEGAQPAEAETGRATLYFAPNQVLEKVHADEGVRLTQKGSSATKGDTTARAAIEGKGQDLDMIAPAMDFVVKGGHQLELAETSGAPQIVITQPASQQKTVVTADRFTARFTEKNRPAILHGEANTKIVGSAPGQPDRVSTSPTLDVRFQAEGGISTITQAGGLSYVSGTQRAWAWQGSYTATDQMLVLSGSPRIEDGGLTTTADTILMNRATGDATAEGNVKSTYSDLKPLPNGGMLASSDPIHVVSRSMTAHRSTAVAVYTGNARLWQNSNVVEAPVLQFDREHRALVAEGNSSQAVKTVLVQVDKTGRVTPVVITSAHLTYNDSDRKVVLNGGVTAKGSDATMKARQMTVFLLPRSKAQDTTGKTSSGAASSTSGWGSPGQVEKIVAETDVVITEPERRATGDQLTYLAGEEKFVLTGGSLSIFDAERGKITGDSLTFYRHDDRVLVEGRTTSPAVTRTQVAR